MKQSLFSKIFLPLLTCTVLLLPLFCILSQSSQDSLAEKAALEQQLKELEEQIADYEKDITKTQQQKDNLKNKIYLLRSQISKLNLQIQQSNIMIKDLRVQINDTSNSIEQTSLKIDDNKAKLKSILRTIYEEDRKSGAEIFLSGRTISDFFDNVVALEALNARNNDILKEIKRLKAGLEGQKNSLGNEKTDLENVVKIQTLQKQQSEASQKTQQQILNLTEVQYQQTLKDKQEVEKKATQIRSRIFELIGVSNAPTFGQAYEIAKHVSGLTGVRPAFLLAVLTQESNIGKNVGQCYLRDTKTGDGIYIKSGNKAVRTMNPTNIPYFLDIIDSINKERGMTRDPFQTPVSCVMYSNGKPYGWGGAMGPSQFIPATWARYVDKLKAATGRVADPWDISDAFLATGLYLKDLGGVGSTNNEFNAAMHYFSGASWAKWEEFYGNSILQIAAQYEGDIKQLEAAN